MAQPAVSAASGRVALLTGGLHCVPAPLHRQERLRRHYVMATPLLTAEPLHEKGRPYGAGREASPVCADHHPSGPPVVTLPNNQNDIEPPRKSSAIRSHSDRAHSPSTITSSPANPLPLVVRAIASLRT